MVSMRRGRLSELSAVYSVRCTSRTTSMTNSSSTSGVALCVYKAVVGVLRVEICRHQDWESSAQAHGQVWLVQGRVVER
jgi:hypothetical protein